MEPNGQQTSDTLSPTGFSLHGTAERGVIGVVEEKLGGEVLED